MVHGTVKGLFWFLEILAITLLVAAAWLGFRLSEGPLELSFARPYIEAALTRPDGSVTVRMDHTVLVWDRAHETLDLRAINVHALSHGQPVVTVPEMSIGLSTPALLRGVIAPSRLRLYRPHVHLVRDTDGSIQLGMDAAAAGRSVPVSASSTQVVEEAFRALLEPPGKDNVAGRLQMVEVVNGDLLMEDRSLGIEWRIPTADLSFLRSKKGIIGSARLDMVLLDEKVHFDADGLFRAADHALELTLSYGGLRPSLLAELAPQLKPLAMLHMPTGGSVGLRWSQAGGLSDLRFDLAGGQGVIDLSDQLGVSWPVASLSLHGALHDGLKTVQIDEARVDFGGGVLSLSGHADHLGPDGAPGHLALDAKVEDLPVELLKGLWPPAAAPNPRQWILDNLSHGTVKLATAHLLAHVPDGQGWNGLAIDTLAGKVVPEGVDVRYLAPMPMVHNASAEASYDQNRFAIAIKSGTLMGLKLLPGSTVVLTGLSAATQYADIGLKISGPVADALRLIDSKPLGWASRLGVAPAKVKGSAVTDLSLRFPLLNDLTFDQVAVHAHAQTSGVGLPDVALGLDLADGRLSLDADAKGLDVAGQARLGGIPASLKWHETFSHAALPSHYEVEATLDDAARTTVGLDGPPFQAPFLSGPVPVRVVADLGPGRGKVAVRGALTAAAMRLPSLNWRKKTGVAGTASARIRLAGGHLADVPHFAVATRDGLAVDGRVAFKDGHARLVTFRHAAWGRTDVAGTLALKPDGQGLVLDMAGASFDARELVSGEPSGQTAPGAPKKHDHSHDHAATPPLSVTAKLDQVWLSDQGSARDVDLSMARDGHGDVQTLNLDGTVGAGQPLVIAISPEPAQQKRLVKISSGDAGAVFHAFGIFDNVKGGTLTVDGAYNDADPRDPLSGLCQVSNYQLMQAPVLVRLLTVAALTGVVDLLSGDGISFSSMKVPFTLTDGVLSVKDARTSGTSLGLTADGQVDLDTDQLALEGTIVPAYALNSALGKLPLVGGLFSAEKGGGVIAMNYSISGSAKDPSVMVNPLSALTPGFLRNLFNIFDDGSGREVRPGQ